MKKRRSVFWTLTICVWLIGPSVNVAQEQPQSGGSADPASAVENESSPDALLAYQDAANFQNNGAFELAVDAWREFLKVHGEDPKAIDARFNLGVCYQQLKQYEQAARYLAEVVRSDADFDRREEAHLNLGWALYSDGLQQKPKRFAEASAVFTELVKKYPKSKFRDQAFFFQGESYYMQGKKDEAIAAYQSVIDNYPDSELRSDAMYALGVTNEELGRFAEAGSVYDAFLTAFGNSPLANEVKMRKAETVLRSGDFAEAERQFAAVAAVEGFSSADHARFRQAFCIAQQERFKEAGELFARLVQDFPQSQYIDQATMAAGRSYFRANEIDPAAHWFERVLQGGSPFVPEAAHWRARLYLDQKDPQSALEIVRKHRAGAEQNPFYVNLLMDEADAMYEIASEREQAVKNYTQIASDHPQHVLGAQALYNAAFGALELKRPEEGLSLAKAFLKRYPEHRLLADVKQVAAECELQLGNNESAEKLFADVVSATSPSESTGALIRQALAMYMEKKFQPAIDLLRERKAQIKLPDEMAEAMYVKGISHLGLNQFEEAESALIEAIKIKPDFAQADEALLNLSKAQRKLNRIDEAIATAERIVSEHPESRLRDRAHFRIAEYRYAQRDYAGAAESYSQVIGLGGARELVPYALYGRGWSEINLGKREAAEADFSQLLKDYGDHRLAAQARYARAMCYHQMGRWETALADLDSFLKEESLTDQERADALYLRGLCQIGLKKPDAAATTLRSILNDHPRFNAVDKVLYELAWVYRSLKRDSDALATFKRLADDYPASELAAEAFYHLAEEDYGEKRFDLALKHYEQALERVGENAELGEKVLYKVGWAQFQSKAYDLAIQAFDTQVGRYPDRGLRNDAAFMKAECLFKLAKYAQAWETFQSVKDKSFSDDQIEALVLLHGGQVAGQLKRWEDSIRWLAELTEKHPSSPYVPAALYEQGWAYQNIGRLPEALKLYTTVTEGSRGELGARARFMMGEILYAQRQYENALREFQKVMYGYGAEKAAPEIKRWQAKAGFEAGQCAGVLASQQKDQSARSRYIDDARKFFEYVRTRHPQTKEATAADEQLKKYGIRS
jgi:TolA-binding protein